jgi:hypothetical protein
VLGVSQAAWHPSNGYGGQGFHRVHDEDLTERGYSFVATAEREIARASRGELCHIALYCGTETKAASESPDKAKSYVWSFNVPAM